MKICYLSSSIMTATMSIVLFFYWIGGGSFTRSLKLECVCLVALAFGFMLTICITTLYIEVSNNRYYK